MQRMAALTTSHPTSWPCMDLPAASHLSLLLLGPRTPPRDAEPMSGVEIHVPVTAPHLLFTSCLMLGGPVGPQPLFLQGTNLYSQRPKTCLFLLLLSLSLEDNPG